MSSDKIREEFETWVKSNWPNQSLDRFNPLHGVTEGEYMGFTVQHCWDAWQASRAAIDVELPKLSGLGSSFVEDGIQVTREHNRYNRGVEDCRKAIRAAGLKVK